MALIAWIPPVQRASGFQLCDRLAEQIVVHGTRVELRLQPLDPVVAVVRSAGFPALCPGF